jgi:hypothetical protein
MVNFNPANNITDFRYTCRVFKALRRYIVTNSTNQKINVDRKDIAGVTMSEKKPFTSLFFFANTITFTEAYP